MMGDYSGREIAILAKLNGCKPEEYVKSAGLSWWRCTCYDNLHGVEDRCTVITRESAQRRREDGPRTLTREDALVIGDVVPARGKAIERAAARWGGATLYKCNEGGQS